MGPFVIGNNGDLHENTVRDFCENILSLKANSSFDTLLMGDSIWILQLPPSRSHCIILQFQDPSGKALSFSCLLPNDTSCLSFFCQNFYANFDFTDLFNFFRNNANFCLTSLFNAILPPNVFFFKKVPIVLKICKK